MSGTRTQGCAAAMAFIALIVPFSRGAAAQQELHRLTAVEPAEDDHFGWSVSISGLQTLVGAYRREAGGSNSGAAFVFGPNGRELFQVNASDGADADQFGYSVSISGGLAIVGAKRDDDDGTDSGSAYVFETTTGRQLFKLTPSDAIANQVFGQSVAISGNLAIVGAPGDDDLGSGAGAAYVFDASTGRELRKLLASDGSSHDSFGISVSISGDRAIVGAWLDNENGADSGSAYVFDVTTGLQLQKLVASDGAAEDYFGSSVSIGGDRAIVGSVEDDDHGSRSGSAYVFDATTGQELYKLTASDAAPDDQFGVSVSIDGDRAVVGAWHDDDACPTDPFCDAGSAYVFDLTTGQELHKLTAAEGAMWDRFGNSVSISGERVVVGAFNDDDACPEDPFCNSGSAYVFYLREFPTYCFGDGGGSPCPCSNEGNPGEGCANSSGAGGRLEASGTASVVADDLVLDATQLLPNQAALLFAGLHPLGGGDGLPFGDGLRCAGGGLVRLGLRFPDGAGDARFGPGLGALGSWSAGDLRRFQTWYRDPIPGSPCDTGFNLTNGVEVSFSR